MDFSPIEFDDDLRRFRDDDVRPFLDEHLTDDVLARERHEGNGFVPEYQHALAARGWLEPWLADGPTPDALDPVRAGGARVGAGRPRGPLFPVTGSHGLVMQVVRQFGSDALRAEIADGVRAGDRAGLPRVHRARLRIRRRRHPHPRRARRRRVAHHRPEDVLHRRAPLPVRDAHRPHQPRRGEAPGDHDVPGAARRSRRRGPGHRHARRRAHQLRVTSTTPGCRPLPPRSASTRAGRSRRARSPTEHGMGSDGGHGPDRRTAELREAINATTGWLGRVAGRVGGGRTLGG